MTPESALARIRDIALALPQAEERLSHGTPTFFVQGGKVFAQYRDDHHGNGQTQLVVKTGDPEQNAVLIEANPDLYSRPAYYRAEWIAVNLLSDDLDWDHLAARIAFSWESILPPRLRAIFAQ